MQSQIKVGQTQAVGALTRCLTLYGRDTLITALQCTQTADGNAGFVRSTIVEALCEVLNEAPAWRDAGEALLRTMDKFKFGDVWDQIAAGRDQIFPSTAKKTLASGQDRGGVTRAAKGRKRTSCCPTDLRAGPTPIPRQQFVEFLDGMFGNAGQDVGEPGLRIDVVHLGGDDQAVHNGGALAAAI